MTGCLIPLKAATLMALSASPGLTRSKKVPGSSGFVLLLIVLAGVFTPTHAALIFHESFVGAGASLTELPYWEKRAEGADIPAQIAADASLNWPGLPASTGGRVVLGNQESYQFSRRLEPPLKTGTVYYAFLLRADTLPETAALRVCLYGKGTHSRIYLKPARGGYQIGVGHATEKLSVYAPKTFTTEQTVFVVVKLTFDPARTNNRLALYINPDASGAEPSRPDAETGGGTSPYADQFILRQMNGAGTTSIDEIRLATTWAGAMGRETPEKSAAAPSAAANAAKLTDIGQRRLPYNNPGMVVDLGVGLWSVPLPMDYDHDGDYDLVVGCGDKPYNGIYLFENDGSDVFIPRGRLSTKGNSNMSISHTPRGAFITLPGKTDCTVWRDFTQGTASPSAKIPFKQDFYSGRQNIWRYGDFDGDGIDDLYFGVDDWRDYGWDAAFNDKGVWTNGPLHGYVYWARNTGSNEKPEYSASQKIEPIDTQGFPTPCLIDWDSDSDLDFICGEFLDRISFFENTGTRTQPVYAPGRFLEVDGKVMHLELEMPLLSSVDWDHDGDPDLIVGIEDGRVIYIENRDGGKIAAPVYFKQRADRIKTGALVTPECVDWDGDGDPDLIAGNSAGFVEFVENLGGSGSNTVWAAPVRLKAKGLEIRIQAGKNGSVQGPCEAKWGYTEVSVADWNGDGLSDLLLNGITGRIIWYKNIGTRSAPAFDGPYPVEVAWPANQPPPTPIWNWQAPGPNDLIVQWRTRPNAIDLDRDGLMDLVLLDHEGYLAWYQKRADGKLEPGKRIFKMAKGENCVLDMNGAPVTFDQNKDGINDLTQSTHKGELLYYARTHTYDGPRRYYLATASESLEGSTFPAGDNTGSLLRANCGMAGLSGRCNYRLFDWDGDGDIDLLINTENTGFLENIGDNSNFIFVNRGNIVADILTGHTTCPAVPDLTGEGVPDLLIGAEDGYFHYYPRTTYGELLGDKKPAGTPDVK